MAGDAWLNEHDAGARLAQDIMEKINERNKQNKNSTSYSKLNAQIRSSMKQFSSKLNKLRDDLMKLSTSYHITQREVDRRQIMMDNLKTKEKQMEAAFRHDNSDTRYSLLGTGTSQSGYNAWGIGQEEPEEYRGVTSQDIRQQQQSIIREQDQGLDVLSNAIARQKQMALDIGDEVDAQNDLLDDIIDHTDQTGERLLKETRHIAIVDRKSNTCCYWVIIILLFIAIVVIAAVPFHGKA
ncbi:syntaxin-8-like [Liolophura sinensis]|uniref:syntaxin-8-like n=1 Tax=Liolophura sinensis TaxID=3198878 RepID=UPI003158DB7F